MEYYELINSDYLECCQKSHICYKVKVELLDHYENTLGELTTSISNTSGSINISYSQGVRRNCNISAFNYNHKFDLDKHDSDFFINRKFKVYTGIQANSDTYWFSQGIFITQSCSSDNNIISISGVDKFGLFTDALNSNKLQTAHSIQNWTNPKSGFSPQYSIFRFRGHKGFCAPGCTNRVETINQICGLSNFG